MNVLIIFAHPDVDNQSIGNKVVLEGLKQFEEQSEKLEIRELYKLYPDFKIDVAAEQDALRKADLIVLQFPFFWYSTPALIKEWFDVVLTHGFAYGSTGKELRGKELLLSFTVGGAAEAYTPEGYNTYPIDEFMPPFKQTANLCEMIFVDDYIYSHGVLNIPGVDYPRETTISIAQKHTDRLISALKAKISGESVKAEIKMKKKPVYFIGQVDVKDFEAYMTQYGMPVVGQLVERGVEILSATADAKIVEGNWPDSWDVLFKFPSQEDFEDFWSSDAYAPFKKLRREQLTKSDGAIAVLPGFDPDDLG